MTEGIDWEARLREANERLAEQPSDRRAELQRVQATLGKGKFAVAAAMARVYLERVPDDPRAWDLYGASCLYRGLNEEAVAASTRAVEADPDYHVARYNLACGLLRLDKEEEALRQLALAFEHCPETVEVARQDEDMAPLRGSARFEALLAAHEADAS